MKKRSKKAAEIPVWVFAITFLAMILYLIACILIGMFKPSIFNDYEILIGVIGVLLLILGLGLPLINCIFAIKKIVGDIRKKANQKKSVRSRSRKTDGFAKTKEYPHKRHPANFKGVKGSDEIEYLTFTHSKEVTFDNKKVKTIPLTSNINPSERGTLNANGEPNISYVYPTVYVGKRSELGKGTKEYSLTNADSAIVDELFKTLPREEVRRTSNSKKKKPRD